MVIEPLAPPAAWILQIHTVRVVGGLAHVCSKAVVKGFYKNQ